MQRLLNAHKLHASALDAQGAETRSGTITSVGPDGTTARVKILPEGNLTGWLPIGHISVGANSIISPPNIGDLVTIDPLEGDAENWVITGRLFSTAAPPPNSPATTAAVKSGEIAIIMHDGSYMHFTNDGTIHTGATKLRHTGDLEVTGEVTAGFGTVDSVTLQQHKHGTGSAAAGTSVPTVGT